MAKRRSSSLAVYRPPTTSNIRISVPRAPSGLSRRKRAGRAVRHGARVAGNALMSSERVGAIVGGVALGMLDKAGTKVPTIPILGRAGTLGVGLWFLGRHIKAPILQHAATGFLAIAAYEMGKDGKIAGDDGVSGDDG